MRNAVFKIATLLFAQGLASAYAADVNVGVSIAGEIKPGVYGRVDIGNTPPPLLYPQPMVIVKQPRPVAAAPLYLHVPPGHAKKWSKHCHKYNACSQPVYFVKSDEYKSDSHGNKKKKHKHDD